MSANDLPVWMTDSKTTIRFSLGTDNFDNCPKQCVADSFEAFRETVLATVSPAKHQKFFCAPLKSGPHYNPKFQGDNHWRIVENVEAWNVLTFDADGFGHYDAEGEPLSGLPSPAECFAALLARLETFKALAYTTSRSTPERPRLRIAVALGEAVSRAHRQALSAVIEKQLAPNDDVLWDRSVYRGEQPNYCPVQREGAAPFTAYRFDGQAICPPPGWVEPDPRSAAADSEYTPDLTGRADSALMAIPNDNAYAERDDWRDLMVSAKEAGVSKEVAEHWSNSFDYGNARKAAEATKAFPYQWRTLTVGKANGLREGLLFKTALKAGWIDPEKTEKVLEQFNAAQPPQPPQPEKKMKVNVNTLFSDMTLTSKEVEKMQSAKFIVPDLVVSGHVAAYISPGNGGKTTIFIHLCEAMVEEGYTVTYLNLDGNPDDLKRHFAHAEHHGYKVISPDACEGGGMDQIMARFKALADSPDTDLNGYVFIIDTLKKVTDVINKSQAKEVYKIFRAMSVKGATVCLLAHANKYKDDAGGLVYEGTADLRNDVDELIYLNPFKDEMNNRLEVTTVPDKMRALVGKRSFLIDGKTRAVTELGYVIGTTSRESRQILDIARKAIEEAKGKLNQKQLVGIVGGESMHGGKKIRAALAHLSRDGGELVRERIEGKNEYEYSINPMFSNVVDLFTGKVSPIIESFNEKGEKNE